MQVCSDHQCYILFAYDGQGTNAYWGEGFSDIIGLTVSTRVLWCGNMLTY